MNRNHAKKLLKGLMKRFNITIDELMDEQKTSRASRRALKADDIVLEQLKERERQKAETREVSQGADRLHPNRDGISTRSVIGNGRPLTRSAVIGDGKDISRRIFNRRDKSDSER